MVVQSGTVGQGGPVNTYSIAAKTGAITLTTAEFNAVVASETPAPSVPPLIFSSDGQPLNILTIPEGYTVLGYTLCGGGGAGAGSQSDGGGGGGSGGYLDGDLAVLAGQSISITLGLGGPGMVDAQSISGEDTILIVNGQSFTAGGGVAVYLSELVVTQVVQEELLVVIV